MIVNNYHIHSRYCDGQGDMQSYVEEALRHGLSSIGFSSHAPLPLPTDWAMPLANLASYLDEIKRLKDRYGAQIEIYAGLELDFAPGFIDFQRHHILRLPFDYLIGSVHFIGGEQGNHPWTADGPTAAFDQGLRECYGGDIRRLLGEYYARIRAMVRAGGIDIVGHLDRILYNNLGERLFSETAPWYCQAVEDTLRTIAAHDIILELNVAGWYAPLGRPNPSYWILQRCRELGIRLTVGTDAHRPDRVASGLQRAASLLHEVGYSEVWRLTAGEWMPQRLEFP